MKHWSYCLFDVFYFCCLPLDTCHPSPISLTSAPRHHQPLWRFQTLYLPASFSSTPLLISPLCFVHPYRHRFKLKAISLYPHKWKRNKWKARSTPINISDLDSNSDGDEFMAKFMLKRRNKMAPGGSSTGSGDVFQETEEVTSKEVDLLAELERRLGWRRIGLAVYGFAVLFCYLSPYESVLCKWRYIGYNIIEV